MEEARLVISRSGFRPIRVVSQPRKTEIKTRPILNQNSRGTEFVHKQGVIPSIRGNRNDDMFAFTLFRRHGNPPRDTAVHGVIFFRLDHIVENITRLIKQDRWNNRIFGIEFNNFFIFHVFL